MRAFLWTPQSGMQVLDPLPGGSISRAFGINDREDVVGTSGSFDGARAVLWSGKGKAQDLNMLSFAPVGTILAEAVGINARGQILVSTRSETDVHRLHEGFNRVVLLTPGEE